MDTDRFLCASSDLSLMVLLKGGRKTLLWGLGLALAIHLSFTQITGLGEEEKAIKPLTTKFIKRQPRLTKPLEMKKHPRPKQRRIWRQMVAVQARTEHISSISSIQPVGLIGSLSRPDVQVSRSAGVQHQGFEPQIVAQAIEGKKEGEQMVDMSLEMVDVDALDTGRYHAMVLQDPVHKRDIKGYFHMARVFPHTAAADQARVNRHPFALPSMLPNLVEAMNKFTDIKTDIAGTYSFDSKEFAKTPIVFVCTHVVFRLTDSEALNLGNYLLNGGFLYTDTLHTNAEINHESIRNIWIDGLTKVGLPFERDWSFENLPNNHPLYTCYFDFEGPPPCHSSLWKARGNMPLDVPDYLTGVTLDGRLVGIMTKRNYSAPWDHWPTSYNMDNTRQLQFGVNIIIFALTQEGSITNRVMDSVSY